MKKGLKKTTTGLTGKNFETTPDSTTGQESFH